MCKIAGAVAIISGISIFGTTLYPSFSFFHNTPSSYFPEQTNANLMRQAVFFSYFIMSEREREGERERNKNPSSCAPLYTNLYVGYYIKTRNSAKYTFTYIYITLKAKKKTPYCFYLIRQCEQPSII